MGIVAFEGVVEHGQIRLKAGVRLPEKTEVYAIVPDVQIKRGARIFSPRLAHPEQVADFFPSNLLKNCIRSGLVC
jgi:hypothetical protein